MDDYSDLSIEQSKKPKWILTISILFIVLIILLLVWKNMPSNNLPAKTNDSRFAISEGCLDNNCSPLIISSKSTENTIDVLFVPSNINFGMVNGTYYENLGEPLLSYNQSDFLNDVNKSVTALFSLYPYSKYKSKFNFYYYNKNVNTIVKDGLTRPELNGKLLENFNPGLLQLGHFDMYIILSPTGAGGLSGEVIQSANVSVVVVHEISHFFGLNDEDLLWTQEMKNSKDSSSRMITNICWDYSCCGGVLCNQDIIDKCYNSVCTKEETGECCVPNVPSSSKYTVPYAELMKYGPKQKLLLSSASIKIIDNSLSNWSDVFISQYEPELNKTIYYPGGSQLGKATI